MERKRQNTRQSKYETGLRIMMTGSTRVPRHTNEAGSHTASS